MNNEQIDMNNGVHDKINNAIENNLECCILPMISFFLDTDNTWTMFGSEGFMEEVPEQSAAAFATAVSDISKSGSIRFTASFLCFSVGDQG